MCIKDDSGSGGNQIVYYLHSKVLLICFRYQYFPVTVPLHRANRKGSRTPALRLVYSACRPPPKGDVCRYQTFPPCACAGRNGTLDNREEVHPNLRVGTYQFNELGQSKS